MAGRKQLLLLAVGATALLMGRNAWAQLNNAPLLYWDFNTTGASSYTDAVRGIVLNQAGGTVGDIANPLDGTNAMDFSGTGPYLKSDPLPKNIGNVGAYAVVLDLKIPSGGTAAYIASSSSNLHSVITNFPAAADPNTQATLRLHPINTTGATVAADTWQRVALAFYGSAGAAASIDNNLTLNNVKISVNGGPATTIAAADPNYNYIALKQFFVGAAGDLAAPFGGQLDNLGYYDLTRSGTSETQLDTALAALSNSAGAQRALNIPGVTYAYTGASQPDAGYPDTGGIELTDNISNERGATGWQYAYSFQAPGYVGFLDSSPDDGVGQPEVTFDLHGLYELSQSQIHYAVSTGSGIHAPDSVVFQFSDDGVNFSGDITSTNFTDTNLERISTFDLAGNTARYVRMRISNDGEWTFLSDVRFFGVAVPEPSSLGLLASAGLALLWHGRRHRRLAC